MRGALTSAQSRSSVAAKTVAPKRSRRTTVATAMSGGCASPMSPSASASPTRTACTWLIPCAPSSVAARARVRSPLRRPRLAGRRKRCLLRPRRQRPAPRPLPRSGPDCRCWALRSAARACRKCGRTSSHAAHAHRSDRYPARKNCASMCAIASTVIRASPTSGTTSKTACSLP